VYHTYWPLKKKCVALKISCVYGGKRETEILQYFKDLGELKPNESKYIIEMYG
uniref:Radical SAM protein n=1 Tax=Meloidogyne hapla TaxID=6305 RepID=A0A1I8AYS1_MELHA